MSVCVCARATIADNGRHEILVTPRTLFTTSRIKIDLLVVIHVTVHKPALLLVVIHPAGGGCQDFALAPRFEFELRKVHKRWQHSDCTPDTQTRHAVDNRQHAFRKSTPVQPNAPSWPEASPRVKHRPARGM